MAEGRSKPGSGKITDKLVAASCAAVLAVYTAGYTRTQAAANKLAAQIAEHRSSVPAQDRVTIHVPELRSPAPIPARLLPPAAPIPREVARTTPAETVPVHALPKVDATPEPAPVAAPELTAIVQVAAPTIVPAPILPPPPAPAKPAWKDGVYTGWGYSRHGNIEAAVVIEGGRITSASISQCRTRYSCSVIDKLIPQVAQRQSPEVDYVSGATESADAFYGGVVEALAKAK